MGSFLIGTPAFHPLTTKIATPTAVEIPVAGSEDVITGLAWPGDHNWVLLVHDVESHWSADSWLLLPERLNQAGFSVLAVDLPATSDDTANSESHLGIEATQRSLDWLLAQGAARRIVACAGKSIDLIFADREPPKIDGLVIVSPQSLDMNRRDFGQFPKLVFVGSGSPRFLAMSRQFFRSCRGWTISSSFATERNGHDLLRGEFGNQICEQAISFVLECADHDATSTPSRWLG
jgi:hypothetical protein